MIKELFKHLKQTFILNGICFGISLVFLFFGLYNIPLGFLFGSIIAILVRIILFFINKLEEKFKLNPWMIPLNVLFNGVIVLLIVGGVFTSLLLEHLSFNIFSLTSVITALIIAFSSILYKKIVGGCK